MALDASIYNALGRGPSAVDYANQFEDMQNKRNLLAMQREQFDMQRQQNALTLDNARRAAADDAALRNYLSGSPDLGTPDGMAGLYRAAPSAAGGVLKTYNEGQKAIREGKAADLKAKLDQQTLDDKQWESRLKKHQTAILDISALNNTEEALASLQRHVQAGDIPQDRAGAIQAALMQTRGNPEAFRQWRSGMVTALMDAKDRAMAERQARVDALNAANQPFNADGTPNVPVQQYGLSKSRAGASQTNIDMGSGQKGFDNEMKLRKDFQQEPIYKAYQEMNSAYRQIGASLKEASPAGDLAAATKIMKLLDPGSVVRESELGMAMAATGMLDRVTSYASNIINGTKLTPAQRVQFKQLADALMTQSTEQYNSKHAEYMKLGSDYGLNAGRAIGPTAAQVKPKAPATGGDGWSIQKVE